MTSVPVNEIFGPTFQGEGHEIGYPCYFLRLHNCPVHCPGCDTYYTWDGSEKHKFKWSVDDLKKWFDNWQQENSRCGLVVSGGEPLIHYMNGEFIDFLKYARSKTWTSVETSGFPGPKPIVSGTLEAHSLSQFLTSFTTVHCSPKVTPCLHGEWSDEQLLQNIPVIMESVQNSIYSHPNRLAFKLVCKDQQDVDVVCRLNERFGWQDKGFAVFLMPYGNNPTEITKQCDALVSACAKYGFLLSPRLHSLIWGNVREK